MPVPTIGGPGCRIGIEEFETFVATQLGQLDLTGKRLCIIIPDDTRSCPMPRILRAVHKAIAGRAASTVCVIALGTHEYLTARQIASWAAGDPDADPAEVYPGMPIVNHRWKDPGQLVGIGTIPAERIAELSEGRLARAAEVLINKTVVEADVKLVVGPILPHEVVGISGGNKYFVPGCAAHELIDITHWVGALITSAKMIGSPGSTPVRAMIDEGASLIPGEKYCLAFVIKAHSAEIESASFGSPQDAWSAQAQVTAKTHIEYVAEPFKNVIAEIPPRYHDIWTAAKGFYKTEPAVADGGEIIIYAPHIDTISQAHPEIYQIGYHCRDYYVKQWDAFKQVPWGVLAHSTHARGAGSYDAQTAVESCRLKLTFATAIPPETCAAVNAGYRDPATIPALMADPGYTVIKDAGEVLFRLESERPIA